MAAGMDFDLAGFTNPNDKPELIEATYDNDKGCWVAKIRDLNQLTALSFHYSFAKISATRHRYSLELGRRDRQSR